jgi:hypothetical protein
MSRVFIISIFLILFFLSFQTLVKAHGFGQSFSQRVGELTIEFEYDSLEVFELESAAYIFRIIDAKTGSAVPFESTRVRFSTNKGELIYSASLSPDTLVSGVSRLTASLPKGEYLVTISFLTDETIFAEAEFSHQVLKVNIFPWERVLFFSLGLVIGGGVLAGWGRFR